LKLNATIQEILKDPEIVKKLEELGFEPLVLNQTESESRLKSEITMWRDMIQAIGLKPVE